MKTKDFFFNLPEELIAQEPSSSRGSDRLLLLERSSGRYIDAKMQDFPSLLPEGALLVLNNSKVRKARLYGESESGGRVEFLFLEELADHSWLVMTTKSKRQRLGKRYRFVDPSDQSSYLGTIVGEEADGSRRLSLEPAIDNSFFERCGHVPLPPYIRRDDQALDATRYQTVYATQDGSVAAPTAGLHFTSELLTAIQGRGIEIAYLTLHVGPGTFLPVRTENIQDHRMHYERYEISAQAAEQVNRAKREKRAVVAVGTTSVRTLEAAWQTECQALIQGEGRTNIFIYPGFHFQVVDQLLTNFHIPESTLLMLVSAFASQTFIFDAYQHAVRERYRFFSYGDAMFIR